MHVRYVPKSRALPYYETVDLYSCRDYQEVKVEVAACIGVLGSLIGADSQR